jgi:hypothetical protein
MRGRKPKSNALKLLLGSRRPLNPGEPQGSVLADASAPAGLDPGAREVWARVVPELVRQGVVVISDIDRLGRTCRLEALGRRLLPDAKQARTREGAKALRLALGCLHAADRVWQSFGVAAPGDRARLRVPPKEEDALAAFKQTHA